MSPSSSSYLVVFVRTRTFFRENSFRDEWGAFEKSETVDEIMVFFFLAYGEREKKRRR